MTRAEHLAWAKERALEYVDDGDTIAAWISFRSDMGKHDETRTHVCLPLGDQQLHAGMLATPGKMRSFIEGFN